MRSRFATPRQYIQLAEREISQGHHELSTGDTAVSPRSFDAALRAAGGALNAIDAIFEKRVANAFCIGRPPGHHANATRGMGFCIFDTLAIAARYAQRKYGIGRALIADWDVHHGNGTQDIFYTDGTVFVFNTHQSPWYPGTGARGETGEGAGEGMTLNCPFPAGLGPQRDSGSVPGTITAGRSEGEARAGADFGRVRFKSRRSARPFHSHRRRFQGFDRRGAPDRGSVRGRPFALGAGRRLQLNRTGCR